MTPLTPTTIRTAPIAELWPHLIERMAPFDWRLRSDHTSIADLAPDVWYATADGIAYDQVDITDESCGLTSRQAYFCAALAACASQQEPPVLFHMGQRLAGGEVHWVARCDRIGSDALFEPGYAPIQAEAMLRAYLFQAVDSREWARWTR